jgi:uncharacterized damage-inducible protein DinB
MNQPGLSADELIAYVDCTAAGWRDLIVKHPDVLALPCDIMETGTVGALLQHIVAAQLRYAERLAELPVSDYSEVAFDSAEAIYRTHQRAIELFRQQLAKPVDWEERVEIVTRRRGPARTSRRTILLHALLHAIRHYAQLATLVRQHGIAPGWPMDYLFMDIELIPQ